MKLVGRLVPLAEVTPRQRQEMYELMDRHYANLHRSSFEADLDEKQWVIQVFDSACGKLCGFSTQMVLDAVCESALPAAAGSRRVKALFSGDTIVDRAYWGDPALTRIWGRLALSLIDAWPEFELDWFLISQGYRTYRFLPVFFHEFYPGFEQPTPAWAQSVIDALGRPKFPDDYDDATGVIRANAHQYRLRQHIAEIAPQRLDDPHVRFFVERNPLHNEGDELCCIAPLTRANFRPAAWRVINGGGTRAALRVS